MQNQGIMTVNGVTLSISRRNYGNDRLYAGYAVQCKHGGGGEDPGALWGIIQLDLLPHRVCEASNAGVSYPGKERGWFGYLTGAEVDRVYDAPPRQDGLPASAEFDVVRVPAGEYLVCTYAAADFSELVTSAMGTVINFLFSEYPKRESIKLGSQCLELYDERCLRWHPDERMIVKTAAPGVKPVLSDWERPEMEIQIQILG